MKKYTVKYQEKISLWQEIESVIVVEDDVDLSNKEVLTEAIEQNSIDTRLLETFPETEDHIEYDFDNVEITEMKCDE